MKLDFWHKSVALQAPSPDAQFTVTVPPEMLQGMTYGGALAPRISRSEALQVPAVLRARNLIAGTLATLPIHFYDEERKQQRLNGLLEQIDPDTTNVTVLAETYEDLLFEGVSWWRITQFDFQSRPMHAEHVPFGSVHVAAMGGLPSAQTITADIPYPANGRVFIDGIPVPDDEIIRFDSPNPPLLKHAARAIRSCLELDRTAARYATEPMPLGYFTPKEGGVDIEDEEKIDEMLADWAAKRRSKAWGYVSSGLDAKQLEWNAEQIQLADQRQHAVLEIARATGIDPEDLGVSTTSRTYANAEQRRLDLLDFTLTAYVRTVEQRLSMNQVSPRGYYARVNMDAFLRSDTKTRMDAYAVGKPLGAYTTDEIRQLENRPLLTAAEEAEIAPQPVEAPQQPAQEAVNAR